MGFFDTPKGVPAKQPTNQPIARANFSGRENRGQQPVNKKVSFWGAVGQVMGGSKVSAVGKGLKPAVEDTSIFAKTKKTSLTRQQAAWYFNEDLRKNENKGLRMKLLKYYPKTPGESDLAWVTRIQNGWFGKVNENASPYAGKVGLSIEQGADRFKIESRINKVLLPESRTEKDPKEKEGKKISISALRDFTGYKKK